MTTYKKVNRPIINETFDAFFKFCYSSLTFLQGGLHSPLESPLLAVLWRIARAT